MSEPQHVSTYVQEALAIGDGNLCQVQHEFIEEVFELCFGHDGINRGFSMDEALAKIREFSDKALASRKDTPELLAALKEILKEGGEWFDDESGEIGSADAIDGIMVVADIAIAKAEKRIQPTFTVGEDGEPMI